MDMKEIKNRVLMYNDRKKYIEQDIAAAFMPIKDFDGISYTYDKNTDAEYVQIKSLIGSTVYLNVTATCKDSILCDVVIVTMSDTKPDSIITDERQLRKVATMFKGRQ